MTNKNGPNSPDSSNHPPPPPKGKKRKSKSSYFYNRFQEVAKNIEGSLNFFDFHIKFITKIGKMHKLN
jgi:hypothetical protein